MSTSKWSTHTVNLCIGRTLIIPKYVTIRSSTVHRFGTALFIHDRFGVHRHGQGSIQIATDLALLFL